MRIDYYHASDFETSRNYDYNPVWEAATEIVSKGWTAELRIPFTQLRFNPGDVQEWGVNILNAYSDAHVFRRDINPYARRDFTVPMGISSASATSCWVSDCR